MKKYILAALFCGTFLKYNFNYNYFKFNYNDEIT